MNKRAKQWLAPSMIVATAAIISSFFIPEVRRFLGLEKPAATNQAVGTPNAAGSRNVVINGNNDVVAPSAKASSGAPGKATVQNAPAGIAIGHDNNGTATVNNAAKPIPSTAPPAHPRAPERPTGKISFPQKPKTTPTAPAAPAPASDTDSNQPAAPLAQSCPNGICIGGNNNGTANVLNLGPPPPPKPTVSVCVSHDTAPMAKAGPNSKIVKDRTLIRMNTDVNITVPSYMFLFDKPIIEGSPSIDDGRGYLAFVRGYIEGETQSSLGFRIVMTNLGNVWGPGEELDVYVYSDAPIRLLHMWSYSENKAFPETFVFACDKT